MQLLWWSLLGFYSRVKAYLLKISNKGIRACPKVKLSYRLEMQQMHDQIENDKLERDKVDKKGVIVQIRLMVKEGR